MIANSTSTKRTLQPMLVMQGITKSFPGVLANDNLNLDLYASEIQALLGENGAGKSTLMKVLYGFYRADAGSILVDGKPVAISSPQVARTYQIGMVFQDFTLIPAMSVAENIALFLPKLPGVLSIRKLEQQILEVSRRYDLRVKPRALVSHLSIGEQQRVEILKLLMAEARLLILDEPTRVLAPHEVQSLFKVLKGLKEDGYAIVLITHKMKEVLDCADRITVLRGGKLAGTMLRSEASESKLIAMMFEKKLQTIQVKRNTPVSGDKSPLFELVEAETHSQGSEVSLRNINLKIHAGEIVGVAGVSGNGQKELGDLALGMIKCHRGRKFLLGKDTTRWSIRRVRGSGLGFIPENPLTMAIAPYMTVLQNMALTRTWKYQRSGGLGMDWNRIRTDAQQTMQVMEYAFPLYVPARSLSGGNLQRMVIVREMTDKPRLLISSYMTHGLDVQSAIAARQALIKARDEGAGVLFISEDLEELFALSDRLIVLYGGRIVGEFKPEETNVFEVGHLMTGSEVKDDETG